MRNRPDLRGKLTHRSDPGRMTRLKWFSENRMQADSEVSRSPQRATSVSSSNVTEHERYNYRDTSGGALRCSRMQWGMVLVHVVAQGIVAALLRGYPFPRAKSYNQVALASRGLESHTSSSDIRICAKCRDSSYYVDG